jgi:hypothetical protein
MYHNTTEWLLFPSKTHRGQHAAIWGLHIANASLTASRECTSNTRSLHQKSQTNNNATAELFRSCRRTVSRSSTAREVRRLASRCVCVTESHSGREIACSSQPPLCGGARPSGTGLQRCPAFKFGDFRRTVSSACQTCFRCERWRFDMQLNDTLSLPANTADSCSHSQ